MVSCRVVISLRSVPSRAFHPLAPLRHSKSLPPLFHHFHAPPAFSSSSSSPRSPSAQVVVSGLRLGCCHSRNRLVSTKSSTFQQPPSDKRSTPTAKGEAREAEAGVAQKTTGGGEEEGPPPAAAAAAAEGQRSSLFRRSGERWGLREFTIIASALCAIDCTVFPILLTALPAAELLSPENMCWIHELSHQVALYVVMPIGTITTVSNHILHKSSFLTATSSLGLCFILGSNLEGVSWIPQALHQTRLYNTLGCGLLITSSYLGHRSHPHDHEEEKKRRESCCHQEAARARGGPQGKDKPN